ncbi:hypothetical protein MAPG_04868 [Magnaporthiopsis poae ATCC 64411]|uniref:Uncharacterized protein n=1 Tax=Magnaporthiopsis poae (strain ATCC 64411 / 73-15) TaxID=644358 RepID=A0A0C4DXW1_MAGP6|nr:hypothetical protein MAPG_04868 [Magnaporthiopsis poae ATCC 64411]
MDSGPPNIRALHAQGKMTNSEALTEPQSDWPKLEDIGSDVEVALVVLRALLNAMPCEAYHLAAELEAELPLLRLAWVRYRDLSNQAEENVKQEAAGIPDDFLGLMESSEMRSLFLV